MAHYAILDDNNIVTQVIVGKNEGEEGIDWEQWYGEFLNARCKRTSYNTLAGRHSTGGTPFRKNYAGIGFTYDEIRDAFIAPKPFPSWVLDEDTCVWNPPISYPTDGLRYMWDESIVNWKAREENL